MVLARGSERMRPLECLNVYWKIIFKSFKGIRREGVDWIILAQDRIQ
jgi:hypothetical protein